MLAVLGGLAEWSATLSAPGQPKAGAAPRPKESTWAAPKCMMAREAFAPVPNAWGQRGATTAILSRLSLAELEDALRTAWSRAVSKKAR